jgi:hypothetical protein
MGVNEIRDGMDSLLTERLNNVRRVERRQGEAGNASREFQQLFEFAQREKEEAEQKRAKATPENPAPTPVAPPRAVTPEEVEALRKRNQLTPGQLIDIEA